MVLSPGGRVPSGVSGGRDDGEGPSSSGPSDWVEAVAWSYSGQGSPEFEGSLNPQQKTFFPSLKSKV